MILAIVILIAVILLVLLVNSVPGLDATTASTLRIAIIGGALIFLIVRFVPGA